MDTDHNHTLRPGTRLESASGKIYTIDSVIGRGGFGVTYAAWTDSDDDDFDGRVRICIKEFFMADHCERDSDSQTVTCPGTERSREFVQCALRDFLAEGRRLMELDEKSPNIVHVWEVFETNGTAYYSMDFLRGESLASRMGRGPMGEEEIRRLITPIIEAVAMLHRERFTHLDIKPGNIMLARSKKGDRPVLIDFGLSKHYNPDGSATSTVNTKACSDGYAPKEQYGGIETFSPGADVYALGATIYALATGKTPVKSTLWEDGPRGRAIDALPLSASLRRVIATSMASNPSERYADAGAMLAAIGGGPTADSDATEPLATEPTTAGAGRNGFPRWIIALMAAVAVVGFVVMFSVRGCNRTPSPIPANDTISVDTTTVIPEEPITPAPAPTPDPAPTPAPTPETQPVPVQQQQQQQPTPQPTPQPPTNQENINGLTVRWSGVSDAEKAVIMRLIENMVYVQGGTFTMGATAEQGNDAFSDERPTHQVTLSSYRIGRYEVTQAEWKTVMSGNNPSNWQGDNLPVEQVSCNDCQTFIRNLNSKTGLNFYLPTEAQWEYAARGGNRSRGYKYAGGNDIDSVAWYRSNSGSRTHPVGQKSPNELGLYDMAGNVWEWCSDEWYGYTSSSETNPTHPGSSGSGGMKRGGSWYHAPRYCRVSGRDANDPNFRYNNLGLRLAL